MLLNQTICHYDVTNVLFKRKAEEINRNELLEEQFFGAVSEYFSANRFTCR